MNSPRPSASTSIAQKRSLERARNVTIVFSLLIGLASVIAMIAGRDRLILLVIPAAIVASIGAIVLRNPLFDRRRWLMMLVLPLVFWTVSVFING